MNEVQCTIPADVLRYTATALYELAIRQRVQTGRLPDDDGKIHPAAAELLKQAAEVQKMSDFYFELYIQRPNEKEAQA